MSHSNHTPGPWIYDGEAIWSEPKGGYVAALWCQYEGKSYNRFQNSENDGCLLAAAPDLLEALKTALESGCLPEYQTKLAKDAIAKTRKENER